MPNIIDTEFDDAFYEACLFKASGLIKHGLIGFDLFQCADVLYNAGKEKEFKDALSDKTIHYNDEIISIEELGPQECVDIEVTGDNLFYCNGLLTKNSFALPMTLDFMAILTVNEALEALNQVQVKQVKSRFGSKSKKTKFVIGLDLNHMRFYDVEESAQTLSGSKTEADDLEVDEKAERITISKKNGSQAYKPGYGNKINLTKKKKSDFSDFKM
jgi:hypothetical protein